MLILLMRFFSKLSSTSYSSADISPAWYFSRSLREWGVLRANRGNTAA